jgi:hypothetical protein
MRKLKRRWMILGLILVLLIGTPLVLWGLISHQPEFYRELVTAPPEQRREKARKFVAQSLQLRNDVMNEPRWEAAFSDQQVNAWLAEDLVNHFADQIPPGVRDPRVRFEMDRVILGFKLDDGPFPSVITVMARARVPDENVLALTLEKIQAGMLPIPADQLLDKITAHAQAHGLDLRWEREGHLPVALIRYSPHSRRRDIVLEQLEVLNGQIRLSGRSDRRAGAATTLRLPTKRVLQSTFPRQKIHVPKDDSLPRVSARVSSTSPTV